MSPTECERLLGFPAGWTALREFPETEETKNKLFIALIIELKLPSSSAFPLWSNLTQSYIHDVFDDILPSAQNLAEEFQDLTQEWGHYLGNQDEPVHGADPMASGRKTEHTERQLWKIS